MKKRGIALLLLAMAVFALAAGCAKAQQPVQEPDTDSRTQGRPLGKHQKVSYTFHMERTEGGGIPGVYLNLFSEDVQDALEAKNRCGVKLCADALETISARHARGLEYRDRWVTNVNRGKWYTEEPLDIDKVAEADVKITLSRSGKSIKVQAEINGEKTWSARAKVKHMREDTVYLHLSGANYRLTNIQYQDLGYGWMAPEILPVILVILALVAIYAAHSFAKWGDMSLYYLDQPLGGVLLSTGLFASIFILLLLFYGRTHPNLLSKIFFGYIKQPMPSEGPWFWAPAAICAVGILGFGIAVLKNAIGPKSRLAGVLAALGLGAVHTLWYYTVINIILQSFDEIMSILILCVVLAVLAAVSSNSVIKTYHVYSKRGFEGTVYTLESKEDQKK